jgi:hypothetical protein
MEPVLESIIARKMSGNRIVRPGCTQASCRYGERGKAKPVETSLPNGADLEAKTKFAVDRFHKSSADRPPYMRSK